MKKRFVPQIGHEFPYVSIIITGICKRVVNKVKSLSSKGLTSHGEIGRQKNGKPPTKGAVLPERPAQAPGPGESRRSSSSLVRGQGRTAAKAARRRYILV